MKCIKIKILLGFMIAFSGCVRVEIIEETNIPPGPTVYIPKNLVSEKEGLLGQEILIKGEDFFLDSLSFFFNDKRASAYLKNDDSLLVVVPRTLDAVESVFKILTKSGDSLIYSSNFKLKKPKIYNYSKSEVTFGESFWVYGENFDNDHYYLKLFMNEENVSPYNTFLDSVKVVVPNSILSKDISIKIKAQLQEDTKVGGLQLKEPIITDFPSEVYIGASGYILNGENLNPDSNYSKIWINDEIEAAVYVNYMDGRHDIVIPFGPYKDFKINSITYQTANMEVRKLVDTKIKSNHILYSKNNPLYDTAQEIVFNNELYSIAPESVFDTSPATYFLWKFDVDNQLWSKDDRIKIQAYGLNFTQVNNGILYAYRSSGDDGLFKIDLNNYTMENIINIPDKQNRTSPVFFVNNGFLYIGKGKNASTNSYYNDLYRLDLNSNSDIWTSISTDNKTFYGSSEFKYKGETYISVYTLGTGINYALYKFNPTSISFDIVNVYGTSSFVFIKDKCYAIYINPNTKVKYVFDLDDPETLMFTFNLDGLLNDSAYHFFSLNNQIYFYGSVINHYYSGTSKGLYKFSEELLNKFN